MPSATYPYSSFRGIKSVILIILEPDYMQNSTPHNSTVEGNCGITHSHMQAPDYGKGYKDLSFCSFI